MIKFDNLTKYYGNVCAVDNISFEVKKGEILGFLGPNGAGKTTTYRILTGYLQATSGTIKVKDYNIHEHQLEIKKLIGYLPESAPVYHDMLVYDYLNYIADIRGVPEDKKLSHIKSLADLCSLNEVMHKAVNELSKGYRQRVGIAHALMGDPEILVLDEPTVGLDPNQIVETRDIIKRIGKEKTIIFSTHILSEAVATCDRIVVINNGKLAADYTMDKLQELLTNESIEDLFRKITRGNHQ
jgi:ABC-2 type transport system ATP-binding protein